LIRGRHGTRADRGYRRAVDRHRVGVSLYRQAGGNVADRDVDQAAIGDRTEGAEGCFISRRGEGCGIVLSGAHGEEIAVRSRGWSGAGDIVRVTDRNRARLNGGGGGGSFTRDGGIHDAGNTDRRLREGDRVAGRGRAGAGQRGRHGGGPASQSVHVHANLGNFNVVSSREVHRGIELHGQLAAAGRGLKSRVRRSAGISSGNGALRGDRARQTRRGRCRRAECASIRDRSRINDRDGGTRRNRTGRRGLQNHRADCFRETLTTCLKGQTAGLEGHALCDYGRGGNRHGANH